MSVLNASYCGTKHDAISAGPEIVHIRGKFTEPCSKELEPLVTAKEHGKTDKNNSRRNRKGMCVHACVTA